MQPLARDSGFRSLFNRILQRNSRDFDVESGLCRPPQDNYHPTTQPEPEVGTSVTRWIEKCCFSINGDYHNSYSFENSQKIRNYYLGKPINSMDLTIKGEDECPEAYFNFMRTMGCYKTNFTNGCSYGDFKV